jgi:hypothetical protein
MDGTVVVELLGKIKLAGALLYYDWRQLLLNL